MELTQLTPDEKAYLKEHFRQDQLKRMFSKEFFDENLRVDEDEDVVTVEDAVFHPSHYTNGQIECIEAIESSMPQEEFIGYLKGNVLKYVWRYENKGGAEDLMKARWYLDLFIDRVSNMERKR